jgi:hypothetical protein
VSHEPQRPLPASTVQAAGQAASDIIGGLKQSPTLLTLVLLNVMAVAATIWFLNKWLDRQKENLATVVTSFEKSNQANRDLVEQCFVIARENQKDLREIERELRRPREQRGGHDPDLPPPPG